VATKPQARPSDGKVWIKLVASACTMLGNVLLEDNSCHDSIAGAFDVLHPRVDIVVVFTITPRWAAS
jgi:hypothetical protein